MIDVMILYPKGDDTTFDMDYYRDTHMPLFADALGPAMLRWGVTAPSGEEYHAIGWARVESQDAFNAAMAEHGAKIMADVANYTNVAPSMVTGVVVV